MFKKTKGEFLISRKFFIQAGLVLIVSIFGFIYIRYAWIKTEEDQFENVMQIAKTVSAIIPVEDFKMLDSQISDTAKPQYRNIKKILKSIITVNKSARFAYIYSQRNGKLFINADSEAEDSKDYSPPGQEYTEADTAYNYPFKYGKEFITNPVTDRWGTWRSVLIPIKDNTTGNIIAVYAMDFDSKLWSRSLFIETIETSSVVLLLLLVLIISIGLVSKNNTLKDEILKRKRTTELLQESEEKYRLIFEFSPLGLLSFDEKGTIIACNSSFVNIIGSSMESLIGLNLLNLPDKDLATAVRNSITEGTGFYDDDYHSVTADKVTPVRALFTSIKDSNSNVLGGVGIIEDITERKQTETALLSKTALLEAQLNATIDGILVVDEFNKRVIINPRLYEIFNVPKDIITDEDDTSLLKYVVGLTINQDEFLEKVLYLYEHKTETSRDEIEFKNGMVLDRYSAPVLSKDGRNYGRIWTFRDITDRKKTEEALRNKENRSGKQREAIASLAIDEAIVAGDLLTSMKRFTEILSAAIMVDRVSVWKLNKDGLEMECLNLFESGKQLHSSGTILKATEFPTYFNTIFKDSLVSANDAQNDFRTSEFRDSYLKPLGITSMLDAGIWISGKPVGVVCFEHVGEKRIWNSDEETFANTSAAIVELIFSNNERKKTEKEIKHKNKDLLRLNTEKDKFFSIIAHDLRSPFNGLLGFTDLLINDLHKMSVEEIKKIAQHLSNSAKNLFSLLTNLLEWAKMQRGLTVYNPEGISLKNIVEENIQIFYESAKNKGIEIIQIIPEDIYFIADKRMLETTVRNLISNALKFTMKGGSVTISAVESNKHIEISVKDTGIGMNKDIVENLFKLDEQTSRQGTEKEPSTGLGLLLCKEFIEKHNGIISVNSEEGKGSEFIIRLPLTDIH